MSGETDLNTLLASLEGRLVEGVYVFVTLPDNQIPQSISPRMIFKEEEGTTLIILKSEAEAHNIPYEFPCRMITCKVHSSLQAVGFMARIASELAKLDIGVNPVSGFFHDHLFVPEGREQEALEGLKKIAKAGFKTSRK